jgi:hypothetical protein
LLALSVNTTVCVVKSQQGFWKRKMTLELREVQMS